MVEEPVQETVRASRVIFVRFKIDSSRPDYGGA